MADDPVYVPYSELRAAIEEDARVHPVSGRPNREHWLGILARHQSGGVVDGYDRPFCAGCGWDGEDPRYLMPCPEIEALTARLLDDPWPPADTEDGDNTIAPMTPAEMDAATAAMAPLAEAYADALLGEPVDDLTEPVDLMAALKASLERARRANDARRALDDFSSDTTAGKEGSNDDV